MTYTPTLLLILDGYGIAPEGPGNAVRLAHTPTLDRLFSLPGGTQLVASGRDVGLPSGFMGNSEVGHLNLGSGRVVYQDMTRIDVAVEDGTLTQSPVFQELFASVRRTGGRLHLVGLLSDGGVHSHTHHMEAIFRDAAAHDIPVRIHAITDGRDTSPTSGVEFIRTLQQRMANANHVAKTPETVRLSTLCGRFYAMDRDTRWERVQVAWDLLVHGKGQAIHDPVKAMHEAYASGETDEFLKPRMLGTPDDACIRDGDAIFFYNFRADRMRELVSAFLLSDFSGFDRGQRPRLAEPCGLASMASYDATFNIPVVIEKDNLDKTLGEIVSYLGVHQLRLAETEKYAHVTYFFNGGRETPFPLEDRILVNSPKEVATYDLKPEMSAPEVTQRFLDAWATGTYTFVVCNLANPDMVGHTGNIKAVIRALEVLDGCVERIVSAVLDSGGRVLITADHGNAEELLTPDGQPQTAHTCNPVPLVIVEPGWHALSLRPGGKLADIAPTILHLWNVPQPDAMTGTSLINDAASPAAS